MKDYIIKEIKEKVNESMVNISYRDYTKLIDKIDKQEKLIEQYSNSMLNVNKISLLQDEKYLKDKGLWMDTRLRVTNIDKGTIEDNYWYRSMYKIDVMQRGYIMTRYKEEEAFNKAKEDTNIVVVDEERLITIKK